MGITGLLPFVKPASTERHLSTLKGQTAAIDSYCWLHKGAFGCAEKLARGEASDMYVTYCMKYIDMLQTFRIRPIMVFDGQHLPGKLLTEKRRRETRNLARKRATECLKLGKIEEARANFRKCVDITPEMALSLIKECRRRHIDCIVAPYEADAQLAYLTQNKIADFVISEDSDLLAFGCKKVLFKLDLSGVGVLVEEDKLYLATKERPEDFSLDRFRYMCILSGCDYLDSLPGIGLKKALKFLLRVSSLDIYNNITKLPSILNMRQLTVTKEYREQLMIANATFIHQLIFDVFDKKLKPLSDPQMCGTNLEYCCNSGKMLDDSTAFQLAIGNLNPLTLEVLDTWSPEKALKNHVSPSTSIWFSAFKTIKKSPVKKQNSPIKLENLTFSDEIIDENIEEKMVMMYSVQEEPPAKRHCVRNDDKEISPVLSNRKLYSNPFLKQSHTNLKNKQNNNKIVVSKYFFSEETDNSITTDSNTNNDTLHIEETKIVKEEIISESKDLLNTSQELNKEDTPSDNIIKSPKAEETNHINVQNNRN